MMHSSILPSDVGPTVYEAVNLNNQKRIININQISIILNYGKTTNQQKVNNIHRMNIIHIFH